MTVLAQLGCGYWGPNLLRAFTAQPGCRVKWVAELRPERRRYVEESFPACGVTASWQEAVRDPEVDAVVVATPPGSHAELAREALLQGKHVLVEKPLALSTAAVDELLALSTARGRVLMVGDTFLYNPAVRYLKELVRGGQLGRVLYMYAQRLNLGQVRPDVNAWWSLAPHDVSIALFLQDGERPDSVSVRGAAYLQPQVEDVAFGLLAWKSGVTAHIHVSWLDPHKVRKVTVVGDRKMAVFDDLGDAKIAIFDKALEGVSFPRIEAVEPLKAEAAHFLECVRTGATPLSGPAHARDVVAVLEAGAQSLQKGGDAVWLPG